MKLLLNNNLSPRLTARLSDVFPDISHVEPVGLGSSADLAVWEYAQKGGFVIVTKDSDFAEIQVIHGFPPKVIWLQLGNCRTIHVEETLRRHQKDLSAFEQDKNVGILILGKPHTETQSHI